MKEGNEGKEGYVGLLAGNGRLGRNDDGELARLYGNTEIQRSYFIKKIKNNIISLEKGF